MAYKRRRTSRKSKLSKKPFTVSLNSRRRKGITTNSQVQKEIRVIVAKTQKIQKESTRRRFYRCYTCSHCSSVVTSSCKGCEKDTSLKW